MSVFAISDLHLSLGAGMSKEMDIFEGWQGYIEKLKKNWNDTVKDEDTVIIVGDISWAMRLEETVEDFKFLNSLKGKKILIRGNHDFWWSSKKKIEDYLIHNKFNSISIISNDAKKVENIVVCGTRSWVLSPKTDEDKKIYKREVLRLELCLRQAAKFKEQAIVFLHYPPASKYCKAEEIIDLLVKYKIKDCYYGHIHNKSAAKRAFIGNYRGIDFHLTSCDYLKFTPLRINQNVYANI